MKTNQWRVLCFLAMLFLTSACGKSNPVSPAENIDNSQESGNCITPPIDMYFPFYTETQEYIRPDILPPEEWTLQATIPDDPNNDLIELELVRDQGSYNEIWLAGMGMAIRYRTDTSEWKIYDHLFETESSVEGQDDYSYIQLFLDARGTIWAIARSYISSESPILSRYDEITDEFIPVYDLKHLLNKYVYASEAIVDSRGLVWLLMGDNDYSQQILLSFNPETMEVQRHLSGDGLDSIAIGPDDSIFIMDVVNNQVVQYFPKNDLAETFELGVIQDIDVAHGAPMYFDEFQRLWISDAGWLDFSDPQWYTIVRSPIFIAYNKTNGTYIWDRPTLYLKSVDDRYWFSGRTGMAWLDLQSEKWCLFSTYKSHILEDSNHHLWLLADHNLYMYIPKVSLP